MAREVEKSFSESEEVIAIVVLKGAFIFAADLLRTLNLPLQVDFISVQSYGHSTVSSGVLTVRKDVELDLSNKDVLLIEDIIDSGLTMVHLVEHLKKKGARRIEVAVLLDKPSRRKADVVVEHIGFQIEDAFVVGYGLDAAGQYRHLADIAVVTES